MALKRQKTSDILLALFWGTDVHILYNKKGFKKIFEDEVQESAFLTLSSGGPVEYLHFKDFCSIAGNSLSPREFLVPTQVGSSTESPVLLKFWTG